MTDLNLQAVAAAAAIGLVIAALYGPLRRRPLARKARWSVVAVALWFGAVWWWHGDVDLAPPEASIGKALLVFLACHAALQLIDLAIWDFVLGRRPVGGRRVSRLVMHVLGALALLGAAMLALVNQFPEQARGILVTSTVVSAILGLALQDVLGNVIGGLSLEFESPFRIGDWVTIGGHTGEVVGINWRTTTLLTRSHHLVYITNGAASKAEIINHHRPTPVEACDLYVGVAYDHAPGEVREVLRAALGATPGMAPDPPPNVFVHDYGDFAIQYRLRIWYDDHWALPRIKDDALTRVWYHLRRSGMGIPFPIRDVRLRTVADDAAERAAAAERDAVAAALAPVPLLRALDAGQLATLAAASRRVTFGAGETLVRQGDAAGPLYVIARGRVRVDVAPDDGAPVTVAHRGVGDHFGELSVLTGEPRSASVVAEDETTVVAVDHDAFAAVLRADPGVAERLARTVAERAEETGASLAAARAAAETPRAGAFESLLAKIRSVFGLG